MTWGSAGRPPQRWGTARRPAHQLPSPARRADARAHPRPVLRAILADQACHGRNRGRGWSVRLIAANTRETHLRGILGHRLDEIIRVAGEVHWLQRDPKVRRAPRTIRTSRAGRAPPLLAGPDDQPRHCHVPVRASRQAGHRRTAAAGSRPVRLFQPGPVTELARPAHTRVRRGESGNRRARRSSSPQRIGASCRVARRGTGKRVQRWRFRKRARMEGAHQTHRSGPRHCVMGN